MTISLGSIFVVDMSYLLMSDAVVGEGPKNLAIVPLCLFGLGHALFVTI